MAHTPHTWTNGETITAALLNLIETDLTAAGINSVVINTTPAGSTPTGSFTGNVITLNIPAASAAGGSVSADNIVDGTTNKAYTATERTKLSGIAAGATVNRTDAATDTAISTAVANLVNGAPGALDQLNELAAALGNDANFAATIATALGRRVQTWAANTVYTAGQAVVNQSGQIVTANTGFTSGSTYSAANWTQVYNLTGTNTGDQTLSINGAVLTISGANGNSITIPTAGGGAVSDATPTAKGVVQLAGDLGGTAAAPTVPGLSTKTAAMTVTAVKTAAYTAAANEIVPADATSGTFTVTLLAAAADKTRITVKKIDTSTNAVTIATTGTDVFNKTGGSTTIPLAVLNQAATFQYTAATAVWYLVGSDLPLTQLDARFAARPAGNPTTGSYVDGGTNTWTALPVSGTTATPSATDLTARLPDYGKPPTSFVLEPAPTSTVIYAGDDFAGTANTTLAGRNSTLGAAATWTAVSGTWQIDGSGNVGPTAATDGYLATIPAVPAANTSAFTVEVASTWRISGSTGNSAALVLRYTDASNFWYLCPFPTLGYISLYEVIAGTHTARARVAPPAGTVDGSVLTFRIDVWQNDMTVYINTVEQFTYTSPTTGVGSRIVGLRQGITGGYTTPAKWSNLRISTYKGTKYNFPRFNTSPSVQVLQKGPSGTFDDTDANNANVVWDPNNSRWAMYYSGYQSTSPGVQQGLGLAYANTLAGPWLKEPRNPVVGPTNGNVENGAIAWVAGRWIRATENTSQTTLWQTSPDLLTWTNVTVTGLTLGIHDPYLRVNQNGLLELWYGYGDPNASIYRATSTDGGLTWNAPTTPVVGPPPIGVGTYRGNGEPTMYSLPGREGIEYVILCDVSDVLYKAIICAAITTDGGQTFHWRNVAGGENNGFSSYQKFDSSPVFADGQLHIFHSGGTASGNGVNLNSTIGRMSAPWSPNPRSILTYTPTALIGLTAIPTLSGAFTAGQVMTVSNGTWAVTPDSYTYQWLRNGAPIAGATSATYTVTAADVSTLLTATVTAIKTGYLPNTGTSVAATPPVLTNTVAPAVSPTTIAVGGTLTTTNGTWNPAPDSFTYQWRRAGVAIAGATSATYTVVTADNTQAITCAVTAVKANYPNATAVSNTLTVGAGAHDITTISNMVARFRADSITGLANGANISSWPDTSGNSVEALNPSGATTIPTYRTSSIGGQPAVRFAGGTKEFLVSSLKTGSGAQTIIAVITPGNTTQTGVIRGGIGNSDMVFRLINGKVNFVAQAAFDLGSSTSSYTTNPSVLIGAYNPGTGAGSFRINGAPAGTFTNAKTVASDVTVIGQNYPSNNEQLVGDLGELIIYGKILSDAEQALVDSYVQDRYGITVSDYS